MFQLTPEPFLQVSFFLAALPTGIFKYSVFSMYGGRKGICKIFLYLKEKDKVNVKMILKFFF